MATLPDVDDVLTLIYHTRAPPLIPTSPPAVTEWEGNPQLVFYTDGSCLHPAVPCARHATWALVQDTTASWCERGQAVQCWRMSGVPPPALQVLDRGVVPGQQTIGRAELCAAIQGVRFAVCAGRVATVIYTDSAYYVVHVFEQLRSGQFDVFFRSAANMDLLGLLGDVWFPEVRVVKVRSHLDPSRVDDVEQCWIILGNQCADTACEGARRADLGVVLDMTDDAATFAARQCQQLRKVHAYLLDLHAATVVRRNGSTLALVDTAGEDVPQYTMDRPAVQHWLRVRARQGEIPAPPAVGTSVFQLSTWGHLFAWRAWYWAHTLLWTTDEDATIKGVTTLELLCNFVVITMSLPPHPVQQGKGVVEYLDFTNREAKLAPTPLRTWLQSLLAVVRQLERLSSYRLFPAESSTKVASLLTLGEIHPRSGVRVRCCFHKAQETAGLLLAVLNCPGTGELRRHVVDRESEALQLPSFLSGLPILSPAQRKRQRLRRQ